MNFGKAGKEGHGRSGGERHSWKGDGRMDCPVEKEEVNQHGLLKQITEHIRDFLTVRTVDISHM